MTSAYTLAERQMLSLPIKLGPGEFPCDRYGCERAADLLIPSASLCTRCAVDLGVAWICAGCRADLGLPPMEHAATYDLPLDELAGGAERQIARALAYDELLRELPPLERDPHLDASLERLVGMHARRGLEALAR